MPDFNHGFFNERPLRLPGSFNQNDLVQPHCLGGWPNDHFDTVLFNPLREKFLSLPLDKKRKSAILEIEKQLQPWARYDLFRALCVQDNLPAQMNYCDVFFKEIRALLSDSLTMESSCRIR